MKNKSMTQSFYRGHIIERFMNQEEYADFVERYNQHKNSTARNLPREEKEEEKKKVVAEANSWLKSKPWLKDANYYPGWYEDVHKREVADADNDEVIKMLLKTFLSAIDTKGTKRIKLFGITILEIYET